MMPSTKIEPFLHALAGLFLVWAGTGQAETQNAQALDAYNVVWTAPSTDHNGSMPIGNGESGLNLWVEPDGDLVFLVSRTDSWDENERLCKLGRVRIALTPPLAGDGFKQVLKLREGEIEILAGEGATAIRTRVWVDANRQAIHVDADSETPFEALVDLELWRNEVRTAARIGDGVDGFKGPKTVYPDTVVPGQRDRIVWYHRNPVSPWEGTLELQGLHPAIAAGADPLLHRCFGGVIRGEGLAANGDRSLRSTGPRKDFRLTIHTHTQTPATEAQWLAAIEQKMGAADAVGHERALEEHRAWWEAFWNRSWIFASGDADAEAVTRGYVLQRWISACSGRGHFPIKFNGSIFTVNGGQDNDPDYRRWGGCYWFQNTRLPYWPMLASGDFEMMRPLFRMFVDALPLAKIRSPIYFGHEGAFFPETMSFWGTYENGAYGWGWRTDGHPGDPTVNKYIRFHYSGTLELLAMMIDYYKHTEDRAFLQNELLPLADEFLLWWDQHWERDEKGHLHMFPSYACESFWNCTNPTPDVAGLTWNLDQLLDLDDREIGAERRERWSALRKAVPPLPLTEIAGKPAIAQAEGELPKATNSENPNLYAVFPFRLYGVGKPGLEMARHTFENRRIKSHVGWRQDETQAAFLGLSDTAATYLAARARTHHKESRFPAFWGPNFDWIPDQDHGGNLLMGLQTMILQADGGEIRVLPAWPTAWDLDFKLHAPRNTTVEGRVKEGKLVDLVVTPATRRKDVITMDSTRAKVLILTGANNHDWKSTTPVLKAILESSGNFSVDVVEDPERLTRERLSTCDVLLSNWNAFGKGKPPPWSEALRSAYVDFVRDGGGHVAVHAGSSSFYDWEEYQAIGCATWKGGTGHKSVHEFEVRMRDAAHPVTRGLEPFKTTDELWFRPFVQPGSTVLAESFSRTTGNWEPTALAARFGKGRCFTLLLGHDASSMQAEGFITLLLRGAEWAQARSEGGPP